MSLLSVQHNFLRHVLLAEGISANPEKVEKVKNWPVPTNPKELQSFSGLASYYHHFIPKFTAIAKCLHQLVGLRRIRQILNLWQTLN